MTVLRQFAVEQGDTEYIAYLDDVQKVLGDTIQTNCWEDDRFIRRFKEDGEVIGSKKDPEANMWLNPQSWAVISGYLMVRQKKMVVFSHNHKVGLF